MLSDHAARQQATEIMRLEELVAARRKRLDEAEMKLAIAKGRKK